MAKKKKRSDTNKYVFIALFIFLLIISFLLILPFLTAILGALVIALMVYPVFNALNKKIKKRKISALIITMLSILIIIVPLFFVGQQITYQAKVAYIVAKQKIVGGPALLEINCIDEQSFVCEFNQGLNDFLDEPNVIFYRDRLLEYGEDMLWKATPNIIIAVPKILLNMFIIFFILFYLLKDGEVLFKRFREMMPLKSSHKKKIVKKVKDVSQAIIYGHILTAVVQGLFAIIGFYFFGVSSPLLWGIILIIVSIIPFVGAPFIYVPISLLMIFDGMRSANQIIFWKGIGLLVYCILIVSSIDNIIKPKITGDKANINPAVILLGLVGGIALFGVVGIIVGPLVLALTLTFIEIYENEKDEITG